jgi:hypothetical protein
MSVGVFLVYALSLFNLYIWIILPEALSILWKWDIFMVFLFAPLIWNLKEKNDSR